MADCGACGILMCMGTAVLGRPSLKTEELCAEICTRLSTGETLRSVCKSNHMPDVSSVMRWLLQDARFHADYARARSIGYDVMAEQVLDISDTPMMGVKTEESQFGTKTITADMTEHRKLMIDTRKWLLAKLRPDKYGDSAGILSSLASSTSAGGSARLTIEFVRPTEVAPPAPVMKGLIEGTAEAVE